MTTLVGERTALAGSRLPNAAIINLIWNLVIISASLFFAWRIFEEGIGSFNNLGRPVQLFMSLVALVPAVIAVYSSIQLLQKKNSGRYAALALNYLIAALGGFLLLSQWGVFIGFDAVAQALLQNITWLWGLAAAYALFWLAGRLDESNALRGRVEQISLIVGMFTLLLLLWNMGILNAVGAILATYSNPTTWLLTIVIIVAGGLAYAMLREGIYFGEKPEGQEAWQGWAMLSPNIIGFGLFFAGPLLLSLYLSFTNDTVGNVPEIIGFQNYANILALQIIPQTDLSASLQSAMPANFTALGDVTLGGTRYVLGARDPLFWQSLRNTIVFVLLLVPLSTVPALILSLILNSKLPGMKFYRAVYFLPSVAAVVGTALIWRWLYDPTIGFFNYFITQIVGFLNSLGLTVADPQVKWLSDPNVVLLSIVFLAAWQVVGFNTVLFLAGLQGIPGILYEAAYVDGASAWQRFRHVTLPMLAPTTFFVIVTTVITGLQVFNEPYALISSRPLPTAATTSVFYLYNRGFFRFEFGYASAVAWVLFAIIFLVTLIQFRMQRSSAYED